MQALRSELKSMHDTLVGFYNDIRGMEDNLLYTHTGLRSDCSDWSQETRQQILQVLHREDGMEDVLVRFGYYRTYHNRGTHKYTHSFSPEVFAPLVMTGNKADDIFSTWPVQLVNQIYLNDVVLPRMVKRGRKRARAHGL
jgi:hypothetical protein